MPTKNMTYETVPVRIICVETKKDLHLTPSMAKAARLLGITEKSVRKTMAARGRVFSPMLQKEVALRVPKSA